MKIASRATPDGHGLSTTGLGLLLGLRLRLGCRFTFCVYYVSTKAYCIRLMRYCHVTRDVSRQNLATNETFHQALFN